MSIFENYPLSPRVIKGQRVLVYVCSERDLALREMLVGAPEELIIISNIANIVPFYDCAIASDSAAAVEYAVANKRVDRIIVIGHSDCKLLERLLQLSHDPLVARMLFFATPAFDKMQKHDRQPAELLGLLVKENVFVQLQNLATYPLVRDGLAKRRLIVEGWIYDDDSGLITTYDRYGRMLHSEKPA